MPPGPEELLDHRSMWCLCLAPDSEYLGLETPSRPRWNAATANHCGSSSWRRRGYETLEKPSTTGAATLVGAFLTAAAGSCRQEAKPASSRRGKPARPLDETKNGPPREPILMRRSVRQVQLKARLGEALVRPLAWPVLAAPTTTRRRKERVGAW